MSRNEYDHSGIVARVKSLLSAQKTVLRFATATVSSAMLSFLLPLILHNYAGIGEQASVAISFTIAYSFNFIALRKLVFLSKAKWRRDLAFYAAANAGFRFAEFLVFSALRAWGILPYAAALLVVLGTSTVVKFFAYRRLFGHFN